MSRWVYDGVFYRVFCVTLLGVALTFTLILTNVFIDIDGLLSKKHAKDKVIAERETDLELSTLETTGVDDTNYGEADDTYRTKRSIETQNILFHIKSPKVKSILTNRLQSLLDNLDAEETALSSKDKNIITKENVKNTADKEALEKEENDIRKKKDEDMLHLTVHNILLQGIIGHMDMKDVFKRVNSLMLKLNHGKEDKDIAEDLSNKSNLEEKHVKQNLSNDFTKFMAEMVRRNELRNEKPQNDANNDSNKNNIDSLSKAGSESEKEIPLKISQKRMEKQEVVSDVQTNTCSEPNVVIKTTIEINTSDNKRNETITKDNLKGIIKLIYNGQTIKFSHPDSEITTRSIKPSNVDKTTIAKSPLETTDSTVQSIDTDLIAFTKKQEEYLNKFLTEYFKQFPNESFYKGQVKENLNTGRHKRHVKIKFKDSDKNHRHSYQDINDVDKNKKDDDELYVEIETHFDSKGMKGEKKKKLIRSLIDKIEKAIRSDEPKQQLNNKLINKRTHKKVHIKKRLQNPLKYKDVKTHSSINNVIHRQLDNIIISKKAMGVQHQLPNVRDKSGETWKKEYIGPTFLTATKSINSAEMSELDVDFNKVLDVNGIPQRLQKPLNTDMSEETMTANSFYDLGNMKVFIKDIDGSGFSVGYNQYIDEPPDEESIKLFTGLENVIKAYHDNYDIDGQDENGILNQNDDEQEKPSKNIHVILRRSIDEKRDYHSNEYKIIYDNKFLPYENYKDIYEGKSSKTETKVNNSKNVIKKPPFVLDEHIFEKNLKPAEIFSLANLLNRKKRSINVKKISNIKTKFKLNRYLNTKNMANKKIFLNKNRSKREINKIRIIASDCPPKESSDENIFVVSDENLLADRATVKEAGTPEALEVNPDKIEEEIEDTEYPTYKIFDGKYRRNALMSKYPHIFMEEITRSNEDNDPSTIVFRKLPTFDNVQLIDTVRNQALIAKMTTSEPVFDVTEKSQEIQDIVEALEGPKTNYKVTVKIIPKNNTAGINSDFKEVHTSINKSVNKNGLIYSSLVNVSEISKVTNVNEKNNTSVKENTYNDLANKIKTHQDKMQLLLRERQKRINEQLSKLNAEKSDLESIFVENKNSAPHLDDVNTGIPSKLLKILHINTDDANKLFTTPIPITITSTTAPIKTTPQTEPSTNVPSITTQQPLIDNLKKDILRKIDRNEHLTDEVLRKINKNTEILKTFLKKLSEKIDLQKNERKYTKNDTTERLYHETDVMKPQDFHEEFNRKPEIESRKTDIGFSKPIKEEMKNEKPLAKFDVNVFPLDWRNHHMSFQPVNFRKNESHMAIPFVYTYQQPVLPKVSPPITSVVYHGHIHTIDEKNIPHEKENLHKSPPMQMARNPVIESRNDTKFFIDEQLNDYKIIPVSNMERSFAEHFKNGTITT